MVVFMEFRINLCIGAVLSLLLARVTSWESEPSFIVLECHEACFFSWEFRINLCSRRDWLLVLARVTSWQSAPSFSNLSVMVVLEKIVGWVLELQEGPSSRTSGLAGELEWTMARLASSLGLPFWQIVYFQESVVENIHPFLRVHHSWSSLLGAVTTWQRI